MYGRILICGENGSGKSTLGKALADAMGIPFLDCEDYFFPEKGLDYRYGRALTREEAISALQRDLERMEEWIFASVKGDYGERMESLFTHVLLLSDVPREIRMQRVWNRSQELFGNQVLPDGQLYERERQFLEMVKGRPDGEVEEWVSSLGCPVIRVNAMRPVKENVEWLAAAFSKEND